MFTFLTGMAVGAGLMWYARRVIDRGWPGF